MIPVGGVWNGRAVVFPPGVNIDTQCLHLIASAATPSAQYGHVFVRTTSALIDGGVRGAVAAGGGIGGGITN